ncbi:MAG: ribosome maturation factor RimP [Candidatus Eisenbacteria bacterium]|nr:ribosome maturation factor RimP [Candidatus Eisenbacteria bacterium]
MALESLEEDLFRLAFESVEGEGLVLLDVEAIPGGPMRIRFVIDGDGGVTIDDCARVSRLLSDLLDEWERLPGRYRLEVSSPGLDRKIRRRAEYDHFRSRGIRIFADLDGAGIREHRGTLEGLDGEDVLLRMEEGILRIPADRIGKAQLVFDGGKSGGSGRKG